MKAIVLCLNRISRYYKKNKALFILFIAGGILNSLVFCYLYGNLLPMVQSRNSTELYYRQYKVSLDEPCEFETTLKRLNDTGLFENISLGNVAAEKAEGYVEGAYNYYFELAVACDNELPVVKRSGSVDIPEGNELVLTGIKYNETVGDKFEIGAETFIVKGRHTDNPNYISKEMFDKMFSGQVTLVYAFSKENYIGRYDKPAAVLEQLFPDGTVKAPDGVRLADRNNSIVALGSICICYLISAAAFASLLLYLMESCADENIISMIVGSSKLSVGIMSFWEGIVLTVSSGLLGVFLHIILTPVLFSKINVTDSITYTTGDYSLIMFFVFILSSLVVLHTIRKMTGQTPVSARREYS